MYKIAPLTYYGLGDAYTFLNGALTAVTITKVCLNLDFNKFVYIVSAQGKSYDLNGNTDFYESEADFKAGNKFTSNLHHIDIRPWLLQFQVNTVLTGEPDEFQIKTWTMLNGKPQEVSIWVDELYLDGDGWHIVTMHESTEIPKDMRFATRTRCLLMNDYKVIDKDGNESISKGSLKRLLLTPEQQELMKKVEDAVKAAKEAGIKFIFNVENWTGPFAINTKDIAAYECTDCPHLYEEVNGYLLEGDYEYSKLAQVEFVDEIVASDYPIDIQFRD